MEKSPTDTLHINSAATPPHKPKQPLRRRRRCLLCSLCCLSILILVAIIVVVLAFTVFKRRDPTITINSVSISGIYPQVNIPALSIQLNLTLIIDSLVHNPNYVSFTHYPGTVTILYRNTQVGDADVARGRIPSRGSEEIQSNVTLTVQSFAEGNLTAALLGDVLRGEVALDTMATVPGRITLLGSIKKHLVATSDCHLVVGFPGLDVKQQECSQREKF